MWKSAVVQVVVFAIMLTWLTACASPEELRARDAAACASFGFQPGTPDFAACLERDSLSGGDLYGPALHGRSYGPGWYPRPPRAMQ